MLSGCSALRIGYGTGPDLVYWWLDGYIDFTGAQTPRARDAIKQWFAWHRRTQVPDYAVQLARARVEVVADTTPARVCEWQAEVVKRAHVAFDRIAPAAADILLTVTPEQVRYLAQKYRKFNDDYRDDFLQPDPRKRADATLKRVLDRAESLYGDFDDRQRATLAQALARSPFDPQVWLAERQLRQQEVLETLRRLGAGSGATREQALGALNGYVAHLERSPREAYQRYSEELMAFNCGFAANLHNLTTPAQRRHAAEKLAGWEEDLKAIAAAGPGPGRQVEP